MQVIRIESSEDAQVKVSWNKQSGDFAVVHYRRYKWPFSSVEVGNLECFSAEEFKDRGFSVVIESLAAYPHREKTAPSEIESLSAIEQHRFDTEHKHILLTLWDERGLLLQPFKSSGKGGFGTMDSWAARLEFPIDSEEFYSAIRKALEAAD